MIIIFGCAIYWTQSHIIFHLGLKARDIIYHSRDTIARMVGGKAADIIFTSGGTEVRVSSVPGQIEIHQIILFSTYIFSFYSCIVKAL